MDFEAAQHDVAGAHIGGAPGVFVSGIVWLIAGIVWMRLGVVAAFTALSVGGMLIVPASLAIERVVFKASRAPAGNPLERLGLESAIVLFGGILIGFVLLKVASDIAIPALAISIGTRYFAFRTLYNEPFFWILGAAVAAAGAVAALRLIAWPGNLALTVGAIEIGFAALLLARRRSRLTSRLSKTR